ncbi:SDR family oxidoreductase [Planococcus maitriensis]|uniref:SDR family NAD(P)-dependent oxidoreductase n=1 Tax=Planococcus maitriensis TaxID=221799 RepID=A0A365K577_9BACL|nr:SDR family oxidoreductase [Planococcus maitriensis]RAZ67726.1 SDR family NAD(P)-dependent oxidoreductase [Planococcus maitriensis]
MNVLVIGANGQVGRNIVEELTEKGHGAVAMIRKEEQREEMEKRGAKKIVLGDLEKDFSHAFDDVDAVIFAAGSGPKTGPDKTLTIDLWGSVKAADYAKQKGVKRFVQLGSVGSDDPDAGGEEMKPYLVAKRTADDLLEQSGLDYTIVRPGPLSDDEKTGHIEAATHFESFENRSIPRADVARTLAEVVDRKNTYGKVFEILQGEAGIAQELDRL